MRFNPILAAPLLFVAHGFVPLPSFFTRRLITGATRNNVVQESSKQEKSNAEDAPAPIFITIGPQCAGKTTILQERVLLEEGLDVTIDDQEGVYVPISSKFFLHKLKRTSYTKEELLLLNTRLYNRTVGQRIHDNSNMELRSVLRRVSGNITKEEFSMAIQSQKNISNSTSQPATAQNLSLAQEILIQAVEEEISLGDSISIPDSVQLFVVESLFRPSHAHNGTTAVERAARQLYKAAMSRPSVTLAWGNTNTNPRDYMAALHIAERTGRPVHFIPYIHPEHGFDEDTHVMTSEGGLDAMVRRNLRRFLATGKYVPSTSIEIASGRVQLLMNQAQNLLLRYNLTTTNKFFMDAALAKMANFQMHKDRTVTRIPVPPRRRRMPRGNVTIAERPAARFDNRARGRTEMNSRRGTTGGTVPRAQRKPPPRSESRVRGAPVQTDNGARPRGGTEIDSRRRKARETVTRAQRTPPQSENRARGSPDNGTRTRGGTEIDGRQGKARGTVTRDQRTPPRSENRARGPPVETDNGTRSGAGTQIDSRRGKVREKVTRAQHSPPRSGNRARVSSAKTVNNTKTHGGTEMENGREDQMIPASLRSDW